MELKVSDENFSTTNQGTGVVKEETPVLSPNEEVEQIQMEMLETYSTLLPAFSEAVNGLSNNQLRRLIKALVSVPLAIQEYKPPTITEKDIFNAGKRLIEINTVLTMSTLTEAMNKLELSVDNSNTTTQASANTEENKKEETNGEGNQET